jgi:hypothetical protein
MNWAFKTTPRCLVKTTKSQDFLKTFSDQTSNRWNFSLNFKKSFKTVKRLGFWPKV